MRELDERLSLLRKVRGSFGGGGSGGTLLHVFRGLVREAVSKPIFSSKAAPTSPNERLPAHWNWGRFPGPVLAPLLGLGFVVVNVPSVMTICSSIASFSAMNFLSSSCLSSSFLTSLIFLCLQWELLYTSPTYQNRKILQHFKFRQLGLGCIKTKVRN